MNLFFRLQEAWRFRNVLLTLAGREIKIRYKQAFLGLLWVLLQPLTTALVYAVIFGVFARFQAGEGVPYPVFALVGTLFWQLFARSLSAGSTSLVSNAGLLGKVYFPRVYLLLAPMLVAVFDFFLAFVVLIGGSFFIFGLPVSIGLLVIPFLALWTILFAFSLSLVLAPLNGLYRDVGLTIPLLTQLYMFATPVMYPPSIVPERFAWIVDGNPAATLMALSRWAVLGTDCPPVYAIALLLGIPLFFIAVGFRVFFRIENTIVDRI
jgi:lipopolysaccharide transport system permease protein